MQAKSLISDRLLTTVMINRNSGSILPKLSPGLLLFIGLVFTAAIVLGLRYIAKDDEPATAAPAADRGDKLFKDGGEKPGAPAYTPGYRSETTSGDSLDIFTRANTGYFQEDASSPEGGRDTAQNKPAAALTVQAPAAKKVRAAGAAVIPRLTPKTFGAASSPAAPKGAAAPDISEMIKQAQKRAGK